MLWSIIAIYVFLLSNIRLNVCLKKKLIYQFRAQCYVCTESIMLTKASTDKHRTLFAPICPLEVLFHRLHVYEYAFLVRLSFKKSDEIITKVNI